MSYENYINYVNYVSYVSYMSYVSSSYQSYELCKLYESFIIKKDFIELKDIELKEREVKIKKQIEKLLWDYMDKFGQKEIKNWIIN